MKTDNELIAEFMRNDAINSPHIRKPDYSSNWDEIMNVIEKIDLICPSISIPQDLEKLKNGTHGSERYIDVISLPISISISEAFTAIVTFIKWYNENNERTPNQTAPKSPSLKG